MIYFENASYGTEGFNTHLMSYTLCAALANFLDREFYFDFEIPSSTPPDFANKPEFNWKFRILLESERSLVSQLLKIEARRSTVVDRDISNKVEFQLVYSHFVTTEMLRHRLENSIIWDSFSMGRIGHTREMLDGYDLIEWTHTKLSSLEYFFFLPKTEKRELLNTVSIQYLDQIESLAAKIAGEIGQFNAIHLRLGDFLSNYRSDDYAVNIELFRDYAAANVPDRSIPMLVATDGLDQKDTFRKIFSNTNLIFIDEMIFEEFRMEFEQLPFTDFNVLTILNQLLCSAASVFIGTYRSTFTAIIHRIRQERNAKKDFNFWPDGRVARQLSKDLKIVPDKSGFFDWNRYTFFAQDHATAAWMREWDHDLSAIDF